MQPGEQTGYFKSFDDTSIYYSSIKVDKPRAIFLLIHGVGEHSGRYQRLKEAMVELGLSVYALDHRGHGRSSGKRGHVKEFNDYLKDVKQLYELAVSENPNTPVVIFGHSMGGVIAAQYALDHTDDLFALILSSPGLVPAVDIPGWKLKMASILSGLIPSASLANGITADMVSRDPDEVKKYENDPLNHGKITARWGMEFQRAGQECLERAAELKMPLMVIHGTGDLIVDYKGSETLFNNAKSEQKEIYLMPGLYHECLNEIPAEREKTLLTIRDWVDRTAPASAG